MTSACTPGTSVTLLRSSPPLSRPVYTAREEEGWGVRVPCSSALCTYLAVQDAESHHFAQHIFSLALFDVSGLFLHRCGPAAVTQASL